MIDPTEEPIVHRVLEVSAGLEMDPSDLPQNNLPPLSMLTSSGSSVPRVSPLGDLDAARDGRASVPNFGVATGKSDLRTTRSATGELRFEDRREGRRSWDRSPANHALGADYQHQSDAEKGTMAAEQDDDTTDELWTSLSLYLLRGVVFPRGLSYGAYQ